MYFLIFQFDDVFVWDIKIFEFPNFLLLYFFEECFLALECFMQLLILNLLSFLLSFFRIMFLYDLFLQFQSMFF
jgi:hypothetical protein